MKKFLALFIAVLMVFAVAACGRSEYEIAMITDAGDIDDESFNQGTWEGIVAYAEEHNISHRYYRPAEVSDASYLDAIRLAVRGGAKIIVTPGFLFEGAIYQAQELYPDVKFVLIDGVPHDGNWGGPTGPDFRVETNTVSVLFAEHESGFLAGYAAVKDGYENLGYIGGMAVPAVVRFGIGFVAGAYYAAKEDGVTISFPDNRYHYLGNFDETDANKNVALAWYNADTDIIFAAAGGAGGSVMAAAAETDNVMIGVDVDQSYLSPTVVTSAMKELGISVQQILADFYAENFPGGQVQIKDVTNDGVGLPMDTSLFTTFTQADYDTIFAALVDGTIAVPENWEELVAFFAEFELDALPIQQGTIAP